MALAATALKDADPLPDVELCLHESSRALAIDGWKGYSARGAPISQWCVARPSLVALPSYHESDCIYRHRYPFTLSHFRLLLSRARPTSEWSRRR